MTVEIKKIECPELRPYPRNGNVDAQKMTYRWQVVAGGRVMATCSTRREALVIAGDYR